MFCLFWESMMSNQNRAISHRLFATGKTSDTNSANETAEETVDESADESAGETADENPDSSQDDETSDRVKCICFPGITLPSIAGRSHQNFKDLKDAFFHHFDAIRFERYPGKQGGFTNKLSRCPLCKKELIQRSKMTSLSGHMKYDLVTLVVRHLNVVYGARME